MTAAKQKNEEALLSSELQDEEEILEEIFREKDKVLRVLERDLRKEWNEVMGKFINLEEEFRELSKKKKS